MKFGRLISCVVLAAATGVSVVHAADQTPIAAPATFYAVLDAAAWSMDDVFAGNWSRNRGSDGDGELAINAETKQVYASVVGTFEILLDTPNDVAFINWHTDGPMKGCRQYPNATTRGIAPTQGVPMIANWFDYYMCQWLNPGPCSWAHVEAFYSRLKYSATVPLGAGAARRSVDVYWQNYDIDMNYPDVYPCKAGFCGSFPKTVELQFGAVGDAYAGVIEHLSHWTANQNSPPFPSTKENINHSDDVAMNITLTPPAWIFKPRADWKCTPVGV